MALSNNLASASISITVWEEVKKKLLGIHLQPSSLIETHPLVRQPPFHQSAACRSVSLSIIQTRLPSLRFRINAPLHGHEVQGRSNDGIWFKRTTPNRIPASVSSRQLSPFFPFPSWLLLFCWFPLPTLLPKWMALGIEWSEKAAVIMCVISYDTQLELTNDQSAEETQPDSAHHHAFLLYFVIILRICRPIPAVNGSWNDFCRHESLSPDTLLTLLRKEERFFFLLISSPSGCNCSEFGPAAASSTCSSPSLSNGQ